MSIVEERYDDGSQVKCSRSHHHIKKVQQKLNNKIKHFNPRDQEEWEDYNDMIFDKYRKRDII